MRPFFLSLLLVATLALGNVRADETTTRLAQQYVDMPQVQKMLDEMLSGDAMLAAFTSQLPANVQLSDEQKKKIGAVISEAIAELRPDMQQAMVESAASTFTAGELDALIDFMSSSEGGAAMAKMQPYFQKYMVAIGPRMVAIQQKILPQIAEILQQKQ